MVGRANRIEREQRHELETARMISFYSVSPWTKKLRRFTDLMKFWWDEEDAVINREVVEAVKQRRAKFLHVIEKLNSIPWGQGEKVDIANDQARLKISRVIKPNPKA